MKVYDPNPITVTWHADFTYAKQPPAISLLLGRVIPPYGGDTMFSNGYLAYEGLSPGLRATLDGLRAVHYATQLAIDSGMPEDEIVEPPDIWTSRLPAKYRDVGPRVVMAPPGTPVLQGGTYREAPGAEGDPVAWWFYEDQQYSVKRLIAAAGYPADEIGFDGITFE